MTKPTTNRILGTVFLFLAVFLFGYAGQAQTLGSLYAQEDREQLYIEEGESLKSALEKMEQHYNVGLLYHSNIMDGLSVRQAGNLSLNIEEALSFLLKGTNLRFKALNPKTYGIYKNAVMVPQEMEPYVQETVTGMVVDAETGEALPGVNILVQGTTDVGTTTNVDGEFELLVPSLDVTLVFSYIGYERQVISIEGRAEIEVALQMQAISGEELVVIGYGVARSRDIIGSVSQISSRDIENRANPNIVQSLQGAVPGMAISMPDGKPSRAPVPEIRGLTSIGAGGSALVLIDGVEGDLSTVNPIDIESVSVLKDASSTAIYGARGAFGVILVNTKSPDTERFTINYQGSIGINQRTVTPKFVTNGLEWTDAFLTSYKGAFDNDIDPSGINNVFPFNRNWYDELQRRDADPSLDRISVNDAGRYEYYGNTDWYSLFFRDNIPQREHNLSLSGGSEDINYYVSGRFFNQEGVYNVGDENFDQYQLRGKGEIRVRPWFILDNNFSFSNREYYQPMLHYNRQLPLRMVEHQGYPVAMVTNPDGSWTEAAVYTGYAAFSEGTSYQVNDNFEMRNTTSLTLIPKQDFITIKGDFTYSYNHSERTRVENLYSYSNGPDLFGERENFSSLENWAYNTNYLASNITAEITPNIGGNHKLRMLGGGNVEESIYETQKTYRRGLLYPELPRFSLMDGIYYAADSGGHRWSFLGMFFRANYSFMDKYLFEVSGRYDGTSKFPTNEQWGFFPSASLGWMVTEESFMSGTRDWIDLLKVRASTGSLGNGLVSPYSFVSTMNIQKSSVLIDGLQQSYTQAPNLIPSGLTWERVITNNIGIDLEMLQNRLSMTFDYYHRYTKDMYTAGPPLPEVLGSATPRGNNADLKTKGWEMSIEWMNERELAGRSFSYSIKGMLWDDQTWITKFYSPNNALSSGGSGNNPLMYEGYRVGDIWGFVVDGLFASDEEAANHADQSFFNLSSTRIPRAGDMKFRDLNGDGSVDRGNNTLDDPGDQIIIGNSRPRYQYGINLNANWNGFGVSAFFQGVGKQDWYPGRESGMFWGLYNRPYGLMPLSHTGDNVWSEENQNVDAYWPRSRAYLANRHEGPMTLPNTRFLQDVSYIRLKNLTLSYTFSPTVTQFLNLDRLQIFFSGENLFTHSNLFRNTDNFDPEVIGAGDIDFRNTRGSDGDGFSYPMLKTYTFGINVTW